MWIAPVSRWIRVVFNLYLCFSGIRAKQKGNAVYEVMVIRTLCLIQEQVTSYQSIKLVTVSAPSSAATWDIGFHGNWLVLCLSCLYLGRRRRKASTRSLWSRWVVCTASLKLPLFIICHSSTWTRAAGSLWLDFLCHSEGNCLVLSAGWFYWGAGKCLVNVDLQMENQVMIHMSIL